MTDAWAACLAKTALRSLGEFRQPTGVEICETEAGYWIKGRQYDDALELRLRALPHSDHFLVLPDGQLQRPSARVSRGYLPTGPWQPLCDWLDVALPTAGVPRFGFEPIRLQLVRSASPADPGLLLTNLESWMTFGAVAPKVRLDRCRFAVSADKSVLVRGTLLPNIPGLRFVDNEGIGVPVGWKWFPEVDASVVREILKLATDDVALLDMDGSWQQVRACDFVAATRTAIRQSVEACGNGRS